MRISFTPRDSEIETIGDITDLNDFLRLIKEISPLEGERTKFFRGLSSDAYDLKPSLFRENEFKIHERDLLEEFCSYFHDDTRDKTAFEKLMLAQHFGLPTRLLDITLDPLVALYFACQETSNKKCKDGVVYCFQVEDNRILSPNSDRLHLISELAFLKYEDKKLIRTLTGKKGEFYKSDCDLKKRKIKKSEQKAAYLRWFNKLKTDSPGFVEAINVGDLRKYFFIKPIYSNPRIRAQKGGFVLTGFIEEFQKLGINKDHNAVKVTVPESKKDVILKELDNVSVNKMILFPDMENTALYLKEKYQASLAKGKRTLSRKGKI